MDDESSVRLTGRSGGMGFLTFPSREEIDMLPEIRIGKTLTDLIESYVNDTWKQSEIGFPTGLYSNQNSNTYVQNRVELLKRLRLIVNTMVNDFRGFLEETKPYRAIKVVHDNIRRRGINDLSTLTEDEYRSMFDAALQEERAKIRQLGVEARAFQETGHPALGHSLTELGEHVNASSYFNLYIAAVAHFISGLTNRLYGSEATDIAERTLTRFNIALNPLFVEIENNGNRFNPRGWGGVSSFENTPAAIGDSLFYGVRVFHGDKSLIKIGDVYSNGRLPSLDDLESVQIPVIVEKGIGEEVITPQQYIARLFKETKPEVFTTYLASAPGGALISKAMGERIAEKTVYQDYNANKIEGHLNARLLLPERNGR